MQSAQRPSRLLSLLFLCGLLAFCGQMLADTTAAGKTGARPQRSAKRVKRTARVKPRRPVVRATPPTTTPVNPWRLNEAAPTDQFSEWHAGGRRRGTPKGHDDPDKAMQLYRLKRLPEGQTELPLEKYFAAQKRMRSMPQYATAGGGELAPSGAALRNSAEQPHLGTWTSLGPGNIGGRTRAILVNPQDPLVMYAAGVAGGVWKSTDAGQSWTPLTDLLANIAVSAMAFDPRDPETIYAGTGEGFPNGDAVRGAGIFKTTDGGANWTRLAGTINGNFFFVNDIIVSTHDSRRLFAATANGVWRSFDGGQNWARVLNPNVAGGCTDLAARTDWPTDFMFTACGNGQQATVYRNLDAGGAGGWETVLSEPNMGRTALAIAPSNQDVVYAVATALSGSYSSGLHAFFRSTEAGLAGSWTAPVRNNHAAFNKISTAILSNPISASRTDCKFGTADSFTGQSWYDLTIAVDPADEQRIWVGGIDLFRSDDGGFHWGIAGFAYADVNFNLGPIHPDQHFIVFHPQYDGTSNQTMLVGNDGGIYKTENARAPVATGARAACDPANLKVQWTPLNNNYGVTQFYHGAVTPDGKTYLGGTQDNGTVRGTDDGGANRWEMIHGADGGYTQVDFLHPETYYASTQNTGFYKTTDAGRTFSFGRFGVNETGLFITPLAMDPSDPARLYTGARTLYRTTNGMSSWTGFAVPLTTATVSALTIAPTDANHLLIGYNNGAIIRTNRALNLNTTVALSAPTEVAATPRAGFVSWVAFDPIDKNIAYATYSTFNAGPNAGHVFRTRDGGLTWTNIDGTGATALPDIPAHCIVVDPSNTQRLYVGTDLGVFVSIDGGASWAVENTGFANTVTESLTLQVVEGTTYIYAFTHGRGAYKVAANTTGCNYTLTPATRNVGRAGDELTVNVVAAPADGCSWQAASNADWLEVIDGARGTGNGQVTVRVLPNNTLRARTGTITAAGRSITVAQEALPDNVAPTLTITSPSQPNTNTMASVINVMGTATDNLRIAAITWRTDRGASGAIGGAAGSTTNWVITALPLATGRNVITVTARDDAGNTSGAQSIVVTTMPASILQTVAGTGAFGFNGDNIPALQASMGSAERLAYDEGGNLYVAELNTHRVRRIAPDGRITTVAGNGQPGFIGDGGPATLARLNTPLAVAVDKNGNVYISDYFNNRIRRVDAATGVITTYVGTGAGSFSGDDGPANAAAINAPEGLAVDNEGNLYLADSVNNRVRRVNASDGVITTVAGTGVAGFSGDGGQARQATLRNPLNVFVDAANNIYVADSSNFRLRRISADGVIRTVVGNGTPTFGGDGGPATSAGIGPIFQFTLDAAGNIYLADYTNLRIRRVDAGSNIITTVAGGANGVTPDGGGALGARLGTPRAVAIDPAGLVVIGEASNLRLRRVIPGVADDTTPPTVRIVLPTSGGSLNTTTNPIELRGTASDDNTIAVVRWSNDRGGSGQTLGFNTWVVPAVPLQPGLNNITVSAWDVSGNASSARLTVYYTAAQSLVTIAGTGVNAQSGDNIPGVTATLSVPVGLVIDRQGNVIFADSTNRRLRKIAPSGAITAFAGTGELGSSGDGGPAVAATMNQPRGVAIDAAGNVYFTDAFLHRVRKISTDGTITTIAGRGDGFGNYGGDGGPAVDALLYSPNGVAVDAQGNVYIADIGNSRIRRVNASDGKIITVVGNGSFGSGGDDGPATQAELERPTGVAVDAAGNLYIADASAQRIRRINASDGRISTVAGTGAAGYNGDNIPARQALLNFNALSQLSVDPQGNVIIADSGNHRIRKLTISTGLITTIAGTGIAGYDGDSTAPTGANLLFPAAAVVDAAGNLYISDTNNNRIRRTRPANELRTVATVSAASFISELAGDQIAAAFGSNLATATQTANSVPLPTTLAGTTVRVRDNLGTERLAPLFYVSPTQLNFLVPNGTTTGVAVITVVNSNGETATNTLNINTVAPGLFAANANGQGVAAAVVFRRNAAGQESYEPVARFDPATESFVAVPIDLSAADDQVFLILYGTGFRYRSSLAGVTATVGGVAAPVVYAGLAPEFIGLDQANLRLDRSLAGSSEVEVRFTVDGKTANTVRVNIK